MKLPIEAIDPMLGAGHFKVSARSENMIVAVKSFDDGKIHMRLKRENSKYSLQDHYYWVAISTMSMESDRQGFLNLILFEILLKNT